MFPRGNKRVKKRRLRVIAMDMQRPILHRIGETHSVLTWDWIWMKFRDHFKHQKKGRNLISSLLDFQFEDESFLKDGYYVLLQSEPLWYFESPNFSTMNERLKVGYEKLNLGIPKLKKQTIGQILGTFGFHIKTNLSIWKFSWICWHILYVWICCDIHSTVRNGKDHENLESVSSAGADRPSTRLPV